MFDLKLLQTFVAVADTGSFTAAAERLHSAQSTVSQQIGRLEASAGTGLLDRAARPVRLTPDGERLIGYARRILALQQEAEALLADPAGSRTIRVGLPDDLVTPAMSREFARFTAQHPDIRLDVTTGLSRELSQRFREGELDVAVVKEPQAQADAHASFCKPLTWVEAAQRAQAWADPVPLVAFPPGGLYRDLMIEQVEAAGPRWYLAFTGNSLVSVLRAVEAGLGAAILPLATIGSYEVHTCRQFAPVPLMALSVYGWEQDAPTHELLSGLIRIIALGRTAVL
ncbi:MAG: LysR family transcriptional regulator [Erythrobacter sp.]